VWDIGTSKCLHTLTGNTGAIFSLDFSRGDSGLLASGGQDGVIRLWEVGAGAAAKETCLPTRQATVQRVKFSRTNLLLAAGAYIPSKK
jgi:WD40 repeat protein